MKQSKANQAMLKRLLVAVVLMFGFTYVMVLFYFQAAQASGDSQARLPATPVAAAGKAAAGRQPGRVSPTVAGRDGQEQRQGSGRTD